ncbi:hydrolase [Clostridia bacterium]|nr:hydrolase [Clostridia bacterium]
MEIFKEIGGFAAVVFDMDGTLLDTEPLSKEFWQQGAQAHGFTITPEIFMNMVGRNHDSIRDFLTLSMGEGFDFVKVETVREELGEKYYAENPVPLKEGVAELFAALDKVPYIKKAVATSSGKARAESRLSKAGLWEKFDAGAFGDFVTNSKPHPEVFLLAAKNLGVEPTECVALEDSPLGIASAHAAGMKTILIPDILPPPNGYESMVYAKCESMLDVIGLLGLGL